MTTRDPQLYCPEAPITLVNVDAEKTEQARAQQRETGCPVFLTLAQEKLILHEPAVQLVQHYGQKLFAQLWTAPRVRFVFEQSDDFAGLLPGRSERSRHRSLGSDHSALHPVSGTWTDGGLRRRLASRPIPATVSSASRHSGSRSPKRSSLRNSTAPVRSPRSRRIFGSI